METTKRDETSELWAEVEGILEAKVMEAKGRGEESLLALTEKRDWLKKGLIREESLEVPEMSYGFRVGSRTETKMVEDPEVKRQIAAKEEEMRGPQMTLSAVSQFGAKKAEAVFGVKAKLSVEPIAVIPEKAWEKICQKFGLLRFEHMDKEGKTGISSWAVSPTEYGFAISLFVLVGLAIFGKSMWNPEFIQYETLGFLSASAFFILLTGFCMRRQFTVTGLVLHTFCAVFSAVFFIFAFASSLIFSPSPGIGIVSLISEVGGYIFVIFAWVRAESRFNNFVISRFPRRSLVKMIWPEKIDCEIRDGASVTVQFNVRVPEKFTRKISGIESAGLKPCVAVVPEAITLDREEVMGAVKKLDPILYVRQNGFVVILDRCGDFPKEKQVIEWVKKHGFTYCLN